MKHLRLLVRAGLMAAATAAVSIAFWHPLQKEEYAHIQQVTKLAAQSVRNDIADEMQPRLLAQVRLAQICSLEEELTTKEWESYAKLFVAHQPGYLSVQVVDRKERTVVSYIAAEGGPDLALLLAEDGPLEPELLESRRKRDAVLTFSFPLRGGRTGHSVVAPIYRRGDLRGFVIATFDDRKVLETIVQDQVDQGYGIAVLEGKEQIYSVPGRSSENTEAWRENVDLTLPGVGWNVRVWPSANLLGKIESRLPALALLAGSVIGFLLVLTLDFARAGHVKSQELRRTRDQLEVRVQERTAELKALNEKLAAEICERRQAQESLQELSGRLLRLRDEEQRRIARELHDSTTQILAAIAIGLERLPELVARGDNVKAQKMIAQSTELADQATAELRTISFLLHPPILDDLGLEGVLPWYVAGFSSRSGITVDVEVQPELGRFQPELELTLFRILQEALANIHRHSESSSADVTLFKDTSDVTLQIIDHGRGISPHILEPRGNSRTLIGVGIAGMRERVRQLEGRLEIKSGVNGTSIKVALPIEPCRSPSQGNRAVDVLQMS